MAIQQNLIQQIIVMMKPFKRTFFLTCLILAVSSTLAGSISPKIVQLKAKEPIDEVIAINDTTIAVRTASQVLILEGPSFEAKEKKYKFNGPAKLTKEGVGSIQAHGSYFQFSRFDEKNITILESNLNSNMLVTSKYAIFGKGEQEKPTIVKLDLETITLSNYTYPGADARYSQSLLVDFQNGDLAVSSGYELLILNNQTLQLKQSLPAADVIDDVRCIFAYYDQKKNESTYLVGRNGNSIVVSEINKDLSGKYVPEERFNTFDASSYRFDLVITGKDTAIRFDYCDIEYWSNLHSIVNVSYDMKYYMRQRQKVAVSNDESFFVVRNDTGYYEFYRIGDDYDVNRFQAIYVSFNELRKGKTTSDDKSLFLSMSNTRNKHDIAKVDIQAGEFYFITDKDGTSDNQFDFALFHTSYNRLVTLQFKGTSYYLQLRALDSLNFIYELPLKFDFAIAEYKLISSNEWGLTFGLALRIKPYSYDLENDTKLYVFRVEADKIVSTGISQNVTFNLLQPCSKYVISYKARFPFIRAYHFTNLSVAYAIPTYSQYQVGVNIEKNIMIISSGNSNAVINLDKSSERIGSFYTDSNPKFDYTISLILAQKGLLFATPPNIRFEHSMTKKFYNISSPIIKARVSMNEKSSYSCNAPTYYIPRQKTQDCNSVFYIEYKDTSVYTKFPQLIRFYECNKTVEKYNVEQYGDYEVQTVIFISSDKKYVCILVNPWQIPEFMLEIRPIANLSQIIFHKVFEYYSSKYYYISDYHVNFINDSMILFHSPDFLTVYYIEPREFAHTHQMTSITHFDISEQLVALAGPAIDNPSKSNIVVKRLSSKNSLFTAETDSLVTNIVISPLGEMVAVYTKDSSMKVWQVQSNNIIFNKQVQDLTKIEFKDKKTLLVEQKDKKMIFQLGQRHKFQLKEEIISNIVILPEVSQNERIIKVLNMKETTIELIDRKKIYVWEKDEKQGEQQRGSLLTYEE